MEFCRLRAEGVWSTPGCVLPHLLSVDASRHGPCGHDVVHHSLAQALRDLVEFEEVSNAVEHLVVTVGIGVHLLEDGGDVPKDGGIQQSCSEEKTRMKQFLDTQETVSLSCEY